LVGGINTAFGYALFGAIYLTTGWPSLAIVGATIIGVGFNFFSTGHLVFANRRGMAFVPFVIGYLILCIFNVIALHLLAAQGLRPFLGQLIVLPVSVLLSFEINRHIFTPRDH
jgi:putative flippase GtrA